MTILTKDELQETIEKLKEHKGRATELITVYVPQGYDVNAVQRQLEAEKSTAKNIKSTSTRKNVQDALEKMIQHLRLYKKTPDHGLAAFAGNVSEREGGQDLQVWSIEPPVPLNVRIYRCDKTFVMEHLDGMLEHKKIYGFC